MNSKPDNADDCEGVSEPEPATLTEVGRDGGGKALTRNGSGNGGDAGSSGARFRQFGDFDPRSEIPKGPEFVEQIKALFPELTPSVMRKLERMAKYELPSVEEEQGWLKKLRDAPGAGDVIFQLSSRNNKLVAWVIKDFALDLASSLKRPEWTDLPSLLFAEFYVTGDQAFRSHVLHGSCTDVHEFAAIVADSMAEVYKKFRWLGSAQRLHKILKYRSVENELMLNREERLTDIELSTAMNVSVKELLEIKEWNQEGFPAKFDRADEII